MIDTSADAAGPRSSLRTELRDRSLDRDALTGIGLRERALERRVELLALGVTHPVIVRRIDARQEGMGDFQPDRLVESKELLEELRWNGHISSLPERMVEVDAGTLPHSHDAVHFQPFPRFVDGESTFGERMALQHRVIVGHLHNRTLEVSPVVRYPP